MHEFLVEDEVETMALVFLSFSLVAGTLIANTALAQQRLIPKTWDEKLLADWATPSLV